MPSSQMEQANTTINDLLTPDENLDWISTFEMRSVSQRMRNSFILVAVFAVAFLLLFLGLPHFNLQETVAQQFPLITFVTVLTLGLLIITQVKESKMLIALTSKRLIITNVDLPKKDEPASFVWSLYGEDISKVETINRDEGRVIRLLLKPARKTFNYIHAVDLNGVAQASVDEVASKIERYRTTVFTAEEERLDKPEKLSVNSVMKSTSRSLRKQHSAGDLVVCAVIAIGMFCFALKDRIESRTWPSTNTYISYSAIETKQPIHIILQGDFKPKYCVDRIVAYNVGNTQYKETAEQLCFDTREAAQAAAVPQTMTVFYRADKPEKFTIDREGDFAKSLAFLFVATGLIVAAAALKMINPQNLLARIILTWSMGIGFSVIGFNVYMRLEPFLRQVAGRW